LGSNWAQLKKKLSPVTAATTSQIPKTKSTSNLIAAEINSNLEKNISKSSQKETSFSATSLALFAEDNDISFGDMASAYNVKNESTESKIKIPTTLTPESFSGRKKDIGTYVAIDCEFVGVGPEGKRSALARVSIVNYYGFKVLDKFVRPKEKVTDWRTWVSGVTPSCLREAVTFEQIQIDVAKILDGRVLVGHAVHHDLEALLLKHQKSSIRDTSLHPPFRKLAKGKTPGLKKLAKEILKMDIQGGEHSSVEDARATMLLYRLHRKEFEEHLRR
ncbi:RNA exonuclease 4, partial [Nadsonia fulvescens var. elongata DSM 6958]